jgi:hypothetical protein
MIIASARQSVLRLPSLQAILWEITQVIAKSEVLRVVSKKMANKHSSMV